MDLQNLSIRPQKLINIIFVGHVDAGKSTICGRILVDLNKIDERTLDKYKQQSIDTNRATWYLSWCMDLNPEEREKGKTTEVGTATFDLNSTRINILDAPGHKQFVGEMIDGASRADIGILIVSARINEFEAGFKGGQTKEHLLLLKSGNVEQLIVLVNKMDECNWDVQRYTEIEICISKFAKKMFENIHFIPVSGFGGQNIKNRFSTDFYSGPSFLEYLDELEISRIERKSCLSIVEKIKTSGNIIFYVKIEGGKFNKNIEYRILPLLKEEKITAIFNEDDVEVSETIVGETYKMKFKDHSEDILVGHKLVGLDNTDYQVCNEMYAQIGILEVNNALTIGYSAIIHINLLTVFCKITEIISLEKKKLRVARKNEKVIVKIKLDAPVVVQCNENRKDRFSLRDESLTIASGVVKKVLN